MSAAGASPRTVIRGESLHGVGAIVDWLRFTFLPIGGSVCLVRSGAAGSSEKSGSLRGARMVRINGESWVVVHDVGSGSVRLENPATFVGRGVMMVGNIEGQRVAIWTGAARPASPVVGLGVQK